MLTGNSAHPVKNTAGKDDDEHTYVYKAEDIASHKDIDLTVGGLILIGLLRGGDYDPEGLPSCGPKVAHALAKCGFGDSLLTAARTLPQDDLPAFLSNWRHEVCQELKTNARGFLDSKKAKLAQSFPDTFPNIEILLLYTNPLTSEKSSRSKNISYLWNTEPNLSELANLCERKFEWGVKEIIVKRFRTVMWSPIVLRILRRAILDEDERQSKAEDQTASLTSTPKKQRGSGKPNPPGTPSSKITKYFSSLNIASDDEDDEETLIVKIHSKRSHASTDEIPEYRLEINPTQLVRLTESGIQGCRQLPGSSSANLSEDDSDDDPSDSEKPKKNGPAKPPPEPHSHLRVWMPSSMVRLVEPRLVDDFETKEEKKRQKKTDAVKRKATKAGGSRAGATSKVKQKNAALAGPSASCERSSEEDFSDVFGLGNSGEKISKARKKQTMREAVVYEEEEEEEEEEQYLTDKASDLKINHREYRERLTDKSIPQEKGSKSKSKSKGDTGQINTQNLPERSAFIDVLNRTDRSPSTIRTSQKPVPLSTTSHVTYRAPFPSTLSDSDLEDDLVPTRSIASTRTTGTRKMSSRTSDSDADLRISTPKKSPRKSKEHRMPIYTRVKYDEVVPLDNARVSSSSKPLLMARKTKPALELEEELEEDYSRAPSPSPLRRTIGRVIKPNARAPELNLPSIRKAQYSTTVSDVIELSSDSDSSVSSQAKFASKSIAGTVRAKATKRKELTSMVQIPTDIIDLT